MTEQVRTITPAKPNGALRFLTVLGMLLLGGGLIWVFTAIKKADYDATVESYTRAISADNGNYIGGWADVTTNYTVAWIAGAVAVLGAIMLIAALAIKAARPQA